MARVSTDDAARNLRYIWLGPPGVRWPFDATFAAWALALLGTVVLVTIDWLVVPTVFAKAAFTPVAPMLAVLGVKTVMRFVTPDEPIRYHAQVLVGEVKATRPDNAPRVSARALPRGIFTELDPTAMTATVTRIPTPVLSTESPEETP